MCSYVENIIKLFSLKLPNHQKVDSGCTIPQMDLYKGYVVLSPPFWGRHIVFLLSVRQS